jgi:uncharacterized protein YkwD
MKRTRLLWVVFYASAGLLAAGCPLDSTSSTDRPPPRTSGTTGSTTSGTSDGGDVGPPVTSPDSGSDPNGQVSPGGVDSSTIDTTGQGSSTNGSSDQLSVEFPGCNDSAEATFWRNEVLRLVNQERRTRGLNNVTWNDTLAEEATHYACELIYYQYFDHVNPVTGETLADRARTASYDFWIIGENLAAGQRTPAQAVADWMNSACHRENILNPAFTELGVGVRVGGSYGYYWVQEFGRPYSIARYAGDAYHDPQCQHTK